jgi:hypothetical protein
MANQLRMLRKISRINRLLANRLWPLVLPGVPICREAYEFLN